MGDPFIRSYIEDLLKNIRIAKLKVRLSYPPSRPARPLAL